MERCPRVADAVDSGMVPRPMVVDSVLMNRTVLLFIVLASASGCAPKVPVVDDAASALGGRSRILAVKTLVIEGEGTNGNLGQDMTMEATVQAFQLSGYKRSIDVA